MLNKNIFKRGRQLHNLRGAAILSGVIAGVIGGIVVVGLSRAYFSMGRMKATTEIKVSFIDYENAFVEMVGRTALKNLKTCDTVGLSKLNGSLGTLGTVTFLDNNLKGQLVQNLALGNQGADSDDQMLSDALNSCPSSLITPPNSSPGVYMGCVIFKDSQGSLSFKEMLGVFAKIRIELGSRKGGSNSRLLATAIDCNTFRTLTDPEIKISYQIFFKKFSGPGGVFTKMGSRFYSN